MFTTITSPFACQWYKNNSGNNEEIASNRDATVHEQRTVPLHAVQLYPTFTPELSDRKSSSSFNPYPVNVENMVSS
jgi:hypothetical protein